MPVAPIMCHLNSCVRSEFHATRIIKRAPTASGMALRNPTVRIDRSAPFNTVGSQRLPSSALPAAVLRKRSRRKC